MPHALEVLPGDVESHVLLGCPFSVHVLGRPF